MLTQSFSRPLAQSRILQRLMRLDGLTDIYDKALACPGDQPFFEKVLSVLNVNPLITQLDLARIPRTGAVVVVANHPYGFVEGIVLGALLGTIRPDVKIMANSLLYEMFPAIG